MSRWIRLSNSHGRSARVRMEPKHTAPSIQFQTDDGRVATAAKIIKSPLTKTYSYLRSHCNSDTELAQGLAGIRP